MTSAPPKKCTVLLIEDEVQIRRLLRVSLEKNGYRVAEAATGEEGIAEAARTQPDAVLLDLGLPDVDGQVVLKRLREWSQAPIFILSVRGDEEEKITALDNGANDYITKPFSTGELLARLRAAQRYSQNVGEGGSIPRRDPKCGYDNPDGQIQRPKGQVDGDRVHAAAPLRAARGPGAHARADSSRGLGFE